MSGYMGGCSTSECMSCFTVLLGVFRVLGVLLWNGKKI